MSTHCFLYGVSYKKGTHCILRHVSNKFTDMTINSMTKMRLAGAKDYIGTPIINNGG